MNTNWSTPTTNIFSAMNALKSALAAGRNARLIKLKNEDCAYPIKISHKHKMDMDFRQYKFWNGTLQTRESIANDTNKSDFEKYLSANYKACYGTQEAMDRYYNEGLLSPDNFKGMGVCHLVKVEDMIRFFVSTGDQEHADIFKHYLTSEPDERHFYDNFTLIKREDSYTIKKFKRKLWVVELLDKDNEPKAKIPLMVKLLNIILYPLKFIPKKRVLRMLDYTNYNFRIGGVINGFSIEIQIPKKFSFK